MISCMSPFGYSNIIRPFPLWSRRVLEEAGGKRGEGPRSVQLEPFLVHVAELVSFLTFGLACLSRVFAPLSQAGHLPRQVQLFATLCFDDPYNAVRCADDKVRCVRREITILFHVIQLEADREVVLGECSDVRRIVEKSCELQLEAARARLADDLAEQGFFGRQIRAMIGAERACITQANAAFNACGPGLVDGERVDRLFERIE